jgi:hypothetical protein
LPATFWRCAIRGVPSAFHRHSSLTVARNKNWPSLLDEPARQPVRRRRDR